MGYSASKETIDRVRPILDAMLLAIDTNAPISFESKDPRKAAYAIRDALASAAYFESEKKYLVIKEKFLLKQKPDRIIFKPRSGRTIAEVNPQQELIEAYNSKGELTIDNAKSVYEVVGACIEHKAHTMVFPNALLAPIELTKVAGWCIRNGYKLDKTSPLTIMRNESNQQTHQPNQG